MMKRLPFIALIAGTLTFLCSMMLPEKSGDTWWYVRGKPYYWHFQPDVFAFRTFNKTLFTEPLDTSCVKYLFCRDKHRDKLNIIYFRQGCSEVAKEAVKEMIRSSPEFEAEFPVITLHPELPYSSAAWFVLDDLLLVNFNPDSLCEKRFGEFKDDYGLKQINFPDSIFPEGIFTYIFEFDANGMKPGTAIDLAKTIYLEESRWVINVQPNLIQAYEKVSHSSSTSAGEQNLTAESMEFHVVTHDNRTIKVYVKFRGEIPLTVIRVYDLFGREMSSAKERSAVINQEFNISDYAGGIYFASIENERREVLGVQKFVKL